MSKSETFVSKGKEKKMLRVINGSLLIYTVFKGQFVCRTCSTYSSAADSNPKGCEQFFPAT